MTSTSIDFDSAVYRLDAIKKAAYRFSDAMSVLISVRENNINCACAPRRQPQSDEWVDLTNAFKTEVLDQELRLSIQDETEHYRNLILSLAFSRLDTSDQ